jgi:hypothetical protein
MEWKKQYTRYCRDCEYWEGISEGGGVRSVCGGGIENESPAG